MGEDASAFPKLIGDWLSGHGKTYSILRSRDRKYGDTDDVFYKKVLVDVLYKEFAVNMRDINYITGYSLSKTYNILRDTKHVRESNIDKYNELYGSLTSHLLSCVGLYKKKVANE